MKKVVIILLVVSCFLSIAGCSSLMTINWKSYQIAQCGTIKVPAQWSCYEENNVVYVVDEKGSPIMIETKSDFGIPIGQIGKTESNAFYDHITVVQTMSSTVFSNGAVYGQILIDCNGVEITKYYIEIGYDRPVELIVWDEDIDEQMVKKIAHTFDAAD